MNQSIINNMPEPLISQSGISIIFTLARVVPSVTSEYTQYVKNAKPLDTRWRVDIDRGETDPEDWNKLEAFVNRIEGISQKFTMHHPMKEVPQGKATGIGFDEAVEDFLDGTKWSDGTDVLGPGKTHGYINAQAAKGAANIQINNLVPNESRVLRENDHFSILHGPRQIPTLYSVTRTTHANNYGVANVEIAPRLRYPVAVGDIVNFWRPSGVFQFVTEPEVEVVYPFYGTSRFLMIEAPEVLAEPI